MKPTGITPTLTAAMVFGLAQAANAADGTYSSQSGAWNLTGSWSGGTIADGTDSTAFFTNDVTAARTTSLGADRSIGHIVFTDADNTTGFNRTIGNAVAFTDNPTFTTAANEKSLIFTGNVASVPPAPSRSRPAALWQAPSLNSRAGSPAPDSASPRKARAPCA